MKNIFIALSIAFLLSSCGQNPDETLATPTDEELKALSIELATKFIITDGHVDIPYRLREKWEDISVRTEGGDFDYVRAKEGGLDAPFMSIYIPSSYENNGAKLLADSLIDMMEGIVTEHPDKFALAYNADQVEQNFANGLISLPMGMENGSPVEGKLENLTHFFNRGIRYITLTHGKDNHICDSSYDTTRTWNGLSPFGEEVVSEMNRLGIMVDISHVSDEAFYDAIEITKAPVIASHSSCRTFTPGWERNISDEMLQKLAENGGVIQINYGSSFLDSASNKNLSHLFDWLTENNLSFNDERAKTYLAEYSQGRKILADITDVVNHIDHVKNLVGIDHVAFGSDFDGVGPTLPEGLKDVSQIPNLIYEMLKRGYSEEEIEKVCYKNVARVWRQVEAVAAKMQQAG